MQQQKKALAEHGTPQPQDALPVTELRPGTASPSELPIDLSPNHFLVSQGGACLKETPLKCFLTLTWWDSLHENASSPGSPASRRIPCAESHRGKPTASLGHGRGRLWEPSSRGLSGTGGQDCRGPAPASRCIQLGRSPCRTDRHQTPCRKLEVERCTWSPCPVAACPAPSMPALPSLARRGGAAWSCCQRPGHQPALPVLLGSLCLETPPAPAAEGWGGAGAGGSSPAHTCPPVPVLPAW